MKRYSVMIESSNYGESRGKNNHFLKIEDFEAK